MPHSHPAIRSAIDAQIRAAQAHIAAERLRALGAHSAHAVLMSIAAERDARLAEVWRRRGGRGAGAANG